MSRYLEHHTHPKKEILTGRRQPLLCRAGKDDGIAQDGVCHLVRGASVERTFVEEQLPHHHAMDRAYKADKEAFVSGLTGSTVGHINAISLLVAFVRPASPHPFHALN